MCGDSICKCPCSLGGDLAVPNVAVGDHAAPTDDSVTGKLLPSRRAALVLPSRLCRSTQGTSAIKHVSSSLVGLSPSWYLQHVIVRDLQSSKSYFFLVNDWLSVESEENDGMVEKEVYAASECSARGCGAGLADQRGRSHRPGEGPMAGDSRGTTEGQRSVRTGSSLHCCSAQPSAPLGLCAGGQGNDQQCRRDH